jgi:hypothetical protein
MTAMLTGMVLGFSGNYLRTYLTPWTIPLLAVILAARELGCIPRFRLLESTRQTEKSWLQRFGIVTASAMWGFHIGFGFATRITYGGFFVLILVCLVTGGPLYSALLMSAYWLGRIAPVWIAPFLGRMYDMEQLMAAVLNNQPTYKRVVALGLIWAAAVSILLALHVSHSTMGNS